MKKSILLLRNLFLFTILLFILGKTQSKETETAGVYSTTRDTSAEITKYNTNKENDKPAHNPVISDKQIKDIFRSRNIVGPRTKDEISEIAAKEMSSIRIAYNEGIKDRDIGGGKVVVDFWINKKGDVIKCGINESTINDHLFEEHIKKSIFQWKFKRSSNDSITKVTYPLVFIH
jgi:outer membrane biosynthesis protein TonB